MLKNIYDVLYIVDITIKQLLGFTNKKIFTHIRAWMMLGYSFLRKHFNIRLQKNIQFWSILF